MIRSASDRKAYIAADFRSMGIAPSLRQWMLNPVARFVILLRWEEYLQNCGFPRLIEIPVRLWFRRLSLRLGFSIGPNIFGPGLALVHYGTIVIDPTTRIGKNCRLHVGVHIGGAANFVPVAQVHLHSPRIGDNVYIGPGAKLYGPIRIGNNCVVGANAVVTRSFEEDGLTLAGVPAKIIARGGNGERVIRGAE